MKNRELAHGIWLDNMKDFERLIKIVSECGDKIVDLRFKARFGRCYAIISGSISEYLEKKRDESIQRLRLEMRKK